MSLVLWVKNLGSVGRDGSFLGCVVSITVPWARGLRHMWHLDQDSWQLMLALAWEFSWAVWYMWIPHIAWASLSIAILCPERECLKKKSPRKTDRSRKVSNDSPFQSPRMLFPVNSASQAYLQSQWWLERSKLYFSMEGTAEGLQHVCKVHRQIKKGSKNTAVNF